MDKIDTAEHDARDGYGCLGAGDSGLPFALAQDEPGKRQVCRCGRAWELRDVVGFLVWQPATVGV